MKYYITNKDYNLQERSIEIQHCPHAEMALVKIYPDIEKQQIIGFGGALTESSAFVYSKMSEDNQKKLLELYFSEDGNRYNFGRLHIQSCDFSLGNRAYVDSNDDTLNSFSIKDDFKYQIPFIKSALEKNKEIEFLASPWSPPAFMKTNGQMNQGGKLKEEYYQSWAKIMVKYILAYKEEGIIIKRITVQNEPAAVQTWDSCVYTATEEAIFAVEYLRKELDIAGLNDVKILIWDHNKDLIIERCNESFNIKNADKAIDGIAFHWYSGDHFEALSYVNENFSDKELIFTEGCVEYSRFASTNQIMKAEMYAHDMIGNLKAGMNGFLDWNLILDSDGGPNHVKNFCDAPVMCDIENDIIDIKKSFYYIGHFSRFIKKNAKRILASSYNKNLETVAFLNPDGSKVVIVLNTSDNNIDFELSINKTGCKIISEAHSIITIVI